MVDPALVYVSGVLVLFFFWIYGIVAFVRDVKNKVLPAYRQYRGHDRRARPNGGGREQVGDAEDGATGNGNEAEEADFEDLRGVY